MTFWNLAALADLAELPQAARVRSLVALSTVEPSGRHTPAHLAQLVVRATPDAPIALRRLLLPLVDLMAQRREVGLPLVVSTPGLINWLGVRKLAPESTWAPVRAALNDEQRPKTTGEVQP